MEVIINDKTLKVIIERKKSNKNTYLRVKEDFNIYVTTNYFVSEREISKLINNNYDKIISMLTLQEKKQEKEEKFYYLGKKYNIVYLNNNSIIVGEDTILVDRKFDLNKWLLKEAKRVFSEEFDKVYYESFSRLPYPSLTIRKMKTRWGVCNTKQVKITLNLELIKKDIKYLDYVIVHELCHLIHANHSSAFWGEVEKVLPNYKRLRKELKNYE